MRIRQATIQNHKNYEHVFGLKSHSNILQLPKGSKITDIKTAEKTLVPAFEKNHILESPMGLDHPVLLSTISNEKARLISLRQVMEGFDPNMIKGPVKARF